MSAPLTAIAHAQFVVSHGKAGALGLFQAAAPLALRRGEQVIVQSARGIEFGAVLCPANDRRAQLLGAVPAGTLLRIASADDRKRRDDLADLEQQIFDAARADAQRDGLNLEILDIDLLIDGTVAVLQFVGDDANAESFAQALERRFGLTIRMENLAVAAPKEEDAHHCDKPDCGRSADGGGGGCTTCSTGGGCSSCGSTKVDMRQYFSHLRTKMEAHQRIPLA